MSLAPFEVTVEPTPQQVIREQSPILQANIRKDLDKLRARGPKARSPLVGSLQNHGKIQYLRTIRKGIGNFRCYFYRSGSSSFEVFYAFDKDEQKLSGSELENILQAYESSRARLAQEGE